MADKQGSAEVKLRGDAIVVIANANIMGWLDDDGVWRGERITDWDAFGKRFDFDAPRDELGAGLRGCLLSSRLMSGQWAAAQKSGSDYAGRLANIFGLRSTRNLYSGMKDVSVDWSAGKIRFGPSRNMRGGLFEGFELGDRLHEDIIVPFASSDDELGAALIEAFRRSL